MQIFTKKIKFILIVSSVLLFLNQSYSQENNTLSNPENFCTDTCTENMKNILNHFNTHKHSPLNESHLYSGKCFYLGENYDPLLEQYTVVLLDQTQQGKLHFSAEFSFYESENPYTKWNLNFAQTYFKEDQKRYGETLTEDNTLRSEIRNEAQDLINIYWMRQNTQNFDLYLLAHLQDQTQIYCDLQILD